MSFLKVLEGGLDSSTFFDVVVAGIAESSTFNSFVVINSKIDDDEVEAGEMSVLYEAK